ncbi:MULTISPECIES: hypothetical protein [Sphingobacterium]|uniref:hypothetical protein n=1 Tax=Sphingobacterium TaxID=28453 RepID=UPI002580E2B4|nr:MULTISPECIES: hypothetical protein [Sphingobacterium]
MEKMKSLADKLREAVKQPEPAQLNKTDLSKTRKEVKHNNQSTKSQKRSCCTDSDISQRINELSFNRETKEPKQVPIRFPATLYSKLRLLGEESSIQKITVYAVHQLIESDEIKTKLKNILKNLNE